MEENNKFWFKIKSPHNEYLLSLQTINNAKSEEILEISLIHKLETGDLEYFLQAPRDELVKDNEILSKYNTISEIFDYFVNCLNNQKIRITRPSIFCYIMHIFNDNTFRFIMYFIFIFNYLFQENLKEWKMVELFLIILQMKK